MSVRRNASRIAVGTSDGECAWRWDGGSSQLQLSEGQRVLIDGADVRRRVAAAPGVIDALVDAVCAGPVSEEDLDIPLPSLASIHSREAPSLVAWAAASALRTLAISPPLRNPILDARGVVAEQCLCNLTLSVDPLESTMSRAALYHLGRDGSLLWCGGETMGGDDPRWFANTGIDPEREVASPYGKNFYDFNWPVRDPRIHRGLD